MRRRILGFFRSVWIWRRILGFFGQFGYGGGLLVFSVSLDMEEDSWGFRSFWMWRRILGFFRLVMIARIAGVANQG